MKLIKSGKELMFLVPGAAVVLAVMLALNIGSTPTAVNADAATAQKAIAAGKAAVGKTSSQAVPKGTSDAGSAKGTSGRSGSSMKGKTFKEGVYYGTGTGFNGKITVRVTIKNSKIRKIAVTKNEGDDASYFSKAKAVIAKVVKAQNTDVDAVSGATYSSNGILEAIENALKKAVVKDSKKNKKTGGNDPVKPTSPDQDVDDYEGTGLYMDGIYEGTSNKGWNGEMTAKVTVSGSMIRSIDMKSNDDEPYFTWASELIPLIIKQQKTEGIDTVSGATYSSKGILDSVSKALDKALKTTE